MAKNRKLYFNLLLLDKILLFITLKRLIIINFIVKSNIPFYIKDLLSLNKLI
jgi:hypothetical protein